MAFRGPEPVSKEDKQAIANEAMETNGGKPASSKGKHPGKLHRVELERLDKGFKVSVHRRSKASPPTKSTKSGMNEPSPSSVQEEYQHHNTEAAFTNKGAAISHVMEHLSDCED